MYERIRRWYGLGLWSAAMVRAARDKGVLSGEQVRSVLGEEDGR